MQQSKCDIDHAAAFWVANTDNYDTEIAVDSKTNYFPDLFILEANSLTLLD